MNKQKIKILKTDITAQKIFDTMFNDPPKIEKDSVCVVNHYVLGKLNEQQVNYKKL
jgi:hypothetical protein